MSAIIGLLHALSRKLRFGSPSAPSASSVLSHLYSYNSANQRIRATREDNAYWDYGYDALGQVNSATKKFAGGSPVMGLDYGYAYDDIGNRRIAVRNASSSGALAEEDYTSNLLNQYAQRTVPGVVEVFGTAAADANVTVNGQPVTQQGEWWYRSVAVSNTDVATWNRFTVAGVRPGGGPGGVDAVAAGTRKAWLPRTPETFAYDADGNLTGDGRWTYTWDGENRLAAMETRADVLPPYGNFPLTERRRLEFAYNGQGRRVQKKVSSWNGAGWNQILNLRFIYDGWNLLAEVNETGAAVRSYVWGLDLSGSMQGAGVGGGLLFSAYSLNLTPYTSAAAYDGNGNVIGLVDMATGKKSATYEYSAFGETVVSDGVTSVVNPFRFSTKYTDNETGLLYYGLRYYNPSLGRFINKDPSEEEGGVNLYAAFLNAPVSQFDVLGLWSDTQHYAIIHDWLRDSPLPSGSSWSAYKWHCLVIDVEGQLKAGNDYVDGTGGYAKSRFKAAQSIENSHQHAMRKRGEKEADIPQARADMERFVALNKSEAQQWASAAHEYLDAGHLDEAKSAIETAVFSLGMAQHPIADDTSPEHYDFQVWHGLGNPCALVGALVHHLKENGVQYDRRTKNPTKYNAPYGVPPWQHVKQVMNDKLNEILKE